jgi:hypothetical protein
VAFAMILNMVKIKLILHVTKLLQNLPDRTERHDAAPALQYVFTDHNVMHHAE